MNASEEHALELIRRRVEGEDTAVDHRELEALLLADPRLCAVYVDYLLLDGALLARGNETAGALVAGETDDCGVDPRGGGSPWLRWRPLAAAGGRWRPLRPWCCSDWPLSRGRSGAWSSTS